jgi:subtilase family serine protease
MTDEVVEVCVANFGDRDVGAFQVSLDQGREVFEVSPLHAGEEQCSLHQRAQNQITVVVDPANLIVESDEQNNSAAVTLAEPPARTTCTPTPTPTRTPTPTPT